MKKGWSSPGTSNSHVKFTQLDGKWFIPVKVLDDFYVANCNSGRAIYADYK